MKLGRVLLLPLFAGSLVACSDPPAAPPEAAAYITVSTAPGGSCNATHGLRAFPQDSRVFDNLNCSLTSPGCAPDGLVVVEGDSNTRVICNVSPSGNSFSFSGTVRQNNDQVAFVGTVTKEGGTVALDHYSTETNVALAGDCTITMLQNRGALAAGRIWAHFTCPDITDRGAAGGLDCAAEGAFLFQKCGGG